MKANFGPFPDNNSERPMEIEVHDYDTWNLDHTIACVVAPLLRQFRDQGVGGFNTDVSDVPDGIGDPNDSHDFKRSEWVVDELIWTFNLLSADDMFDPETEERVNNGLRLFGKYFRCLWN